MAEIPDLSDEQVSIYESRVEGFLADNESGEEVSITFDADPLGETYFLGGNNSPARSDRNGLIEATLQLSKSRAAQLLRAQGSHYGWLSFHVHSSGTDQGKGQLRLIPNHGTSIISDIDDTIKITDILAGTAVEIRNTFFEAFKAVPGMAEFYNEYPQETAFHYVSGGPWQLYSPLSEYLFSDAAGFPQGSFHMKNVRTNPFESESYLDIIELLAGRSEATIKQKTAQIEQLLLRFPQRKFILIGDSGEDDPEIYETIAEQFGEQIMEIKIRDVAKVRTSSP
ncbi:MAG: DUF2183 domain-containing protein [Gammaproteobacteria bacterium]|nr:DUF2183 domain-containing protein [Gammaproteobacteria bacterium]